MTNTLTFRTIEQASIFQNEIKGQLSDGKWENAKPLNHFQPWSEADILVGEDVGRNFGVDKDNYDFNQGEMLDIIGQRMVRLARLAKAGYSVSDAGKYVDLLCNADGIIELPHYKTHTGPKWVKVRAEIKALKESGEYDKLEAALENPEYTFRKMRRDLKEMKLAVRIKTL